MHNATLILTAAGLVVLAGFFAMSDAAVSTVSPARAAELTAERCAAPGRCRRSRPIRPATPTCCCCCG